MPVRLEPMLARLVERVPSLPGWAYEVKWDGIRVIAYVDRDRLRLETRRGNDISGAFPELAPLVKEVGLPAVLDGEIVALDETGRPSFERLQRRIGLGGERVPSAVAVIPVTYVVFDVLYLDGHSTMALPYTERRHLLEALDLTGPAWSTPRTLAGDGDAVLAATRDQGLEGLIAKRLDSSYEPGRRSGVWVKVKNRRHQRFVVGGWVPREHAPGNTVGALVLGYRGDGDPPGSLTYAGRVGTGFTGEVAERLGGLLAGLERPESPFDPGVPVPVGTRFVEPVVVVDVEFLEWTASGVLRQPSFKGVRTDIDPREVQRE